MGLANIDPDGYRLGVGIVMVNAHNQVFWACRSDAEDAWQFPQGGLHLGETPRTALYRELYEEIGLRESDVTLLAETTEWHAYDLPEHYRVIEGVKVVGQKQRWFLLRLLAQDHAICLDRTEPAEFCRWCWTDYWTPCTQVVPFKRALYQNVLTEFAAVLKK